MGIFTLVGIGVGILFIIIGFRLIKSKNTRTMLFNYNGFNLPPVTGTFAMIIGIILILLGVYIAYTSFIAR